MKIGAITQARTSSTRLPRKVLKNLPYASDITALQQVIRRLKKSKKINEVIVATTINEEDEVIVKLAEKEGVRWFRGSVNNVLERHYLSAKECNLDIVVRVTSDCPCVDPEIVDLLLGQHIKVCADYTSNALARTYPHGLDVEVLNFTALEKAYSEAKNDLEREHVCPYIYKTNPKGFKIKSVKAPDDLTAPEIRITLDEAQDYALLCAVFDHLFFANEYFNAYDVVNLFKDKPWLKFINKKLAERKK